MGQKNIRKLVEKFDLRIERLRTNENKVLELFQKNLGDFTKALHYLKKKRETLCVQLEELSGERLENFKLIRAIIQEIKISEKRNTHLSQMIKDLEEKEIVKKSEYNAILSGMAPTDLDSQGATLFYSIYTTNKKLENTTTILRKDELIKRKNDFLETLDHSFHRLESELLHVDKEMDKLMIEKNEISRKIYLDDKEHSALQKMYIEQIQKMKSLRKKIKTIAVEEASLLTEYSAYLKTLYSATRVSKTVAKKLLPVISRMEIDSSVSGDDCDWVVEVEEISDSPGNLISFPKAG